MKQRLHYAKAGTYAAMEGLDAYVESCGLERALIALVYLRISQINGCAYCLDMHWKDLEVLGETPQRRYSLDAWRECPYYSERERAALAWAEAVTRVAEHQVPDAVYEAVRGHFSDKELCDLTLAVAAMNAWNRLSIAGRLTPGEYRPAAVAN